MKGDRLSLTANLAHDIPFNRHSRAILSFVSGEL